MRRQNKQERIAFTEIASGLEDNITQADPLRESGLKRLHKVRSAKLTGQKRELERLSKKLGEKHVRVTALSRKMETERTLVSQVAVNIERTQIETPIMNENTWLLHGRVYSKEIKGVPNLTVGLYYQKGKWLEPFGYVCTDKTGYFRLTHVFEEKKSPESNNSTSDTIASKRRAQIFIRLQDKTGVQVYIGKQPVTPAPGQIEYREIILDDESDTCTPPEPPDKPQGSRVHKKAKKSKR